MKLSSAAEPVAITPTTAHRDAGSTTARAGYGGIRPGVRSGTDRADARPKNEKEADMRAWIAVIPVLLALAPAPAGAQDGHQHPMAADASAATKAFEEANARMMQEMRMVPTGDPDMDFAMMMTPHHRGAVAMARIELQYGKDPELRKLAENIIRSQEEEIAFLEKWRMDHMK
jgi:hypothetical protein